MAQHLVAERLGMTRAQVRRMSAVEFRDWLAYFDLRAAAKKAAASKAREEANMWKGRGF